MAEVVWISHRGYCETGATENTRASFDAARELGFTDLETDLRLTLDGRIVFHHDDDLHKTFGVTRRISESKWGDLAKLRTPDAQSLFAIEDLIDLYPDVRWTFDIKTPRDTETLKALAKWSLQHPGWIEKQVRFLLWNHAAEKLALELFPKVRCLAQEKACYRAGLASLLGLSVFGGIKTGVTYSVPPSFAGLDLFAARILQAYHRRGARLLAYLPPNELLAKKALRLGFDEILTNGRKYL